MKYLESLVALLFLVGCCAPGVFGDAPAKVQGCKPLHGVTYDPFALSTEDICVSKDQAIIDTQIMATFAKSIRLYNIAVCPRTTWAILEQAEKMNVTILLGVFLGPSAEDNEKEMKMMESVMKKHSGVVQAIVVGSDAFVNGDIGSTNRYAKIMNKVDVLVDFIDRAKKILKKLRLTHPVTTAEGWGVWESEHGAALAEAVDFICLKIMPYSEGRPVECPTRAKKNCIGAASYANARATGLSKFYTKDVWVCETGWPTNGRRCCPNIPEKRNGMQAIAAASVATKYLSQFVEGADDRPYYFSSAFDRDWRQIWSPCPNCLEKNLALSSFENGICDLCDHEYKLGIFDEQRERKTTLKLPETKCKLPSLPTVRIAAPPVKEEPKKVKTSAKGSIKVTGKTKGDTKETNKATASTRSKAKATSKASSKTTTSKSTSTKKFKSSTK